MKPKWMRDEEGESGYGSVGGTLLKALLMGVGIAAGIDYLIAKKKKKGNGVWYLALAGFFITVFVVGYFS